MAGKTTSDPGLPLTPCDRRADVHQVHHEATTASDSIFSEHPYMDTGGVVFVSDSISGASVTNHQLMAVLGTDIHLHEKLTFSLDYDPDSNAVDLSSSLGGQSGPLPTDPTVSGISDPKDHRVALVLHRAFLRHPPSQLTLGIGYYNLSNQLAPDGTHRNPLWSPDAVVMFNIMRTDEIYTAIAEKKRGKEQQGVQALRALQSRQARSSLLLNRPLLSF